MCKPHILLITKQGDRHTDLLVSVLEEKYPECIPVRFNLDDEKSLKSTYFSQKIKKICDVELSHFISVYLRSSLSAEQVLTNRLETTTPSQRIEVIFKNQQVHELRSNMLEELAKESCILVNDRNNSLRAQNRLSQLFTAQEIGMQVPPFLVSSRVSALKEFISTYSKVGKFILKPFQSIVIRDIVTTEKQTVSTSLVSAQYFNEYYSDGYIDYPLFVQQYIPKKHDLRVTVIGKNVFSTSLTWSEEKHNRIDWKKINQNDIEYSTFTLPDDLEEKIKRFVKNNGLQTATLDFVVSQDNKYYFIEMNTVINYLWLEKRTKQPITESLADLLAKPNEFKL